MNKRVEFFFDVGSPASYLAWTQLPAICERAGATLVYRPMLLGGVFQSTGDVTPAAVPAKGRYTTKDFRSLFPPLRRRAESEPALPDHHADAHARGRRRSNYACLNASRTS